MNGQCLVYYFSTHTWLAIFQVLHLHFTLNEKEALNRKSLSLFSDRRRGKFRGSSFDEVLFDKHNLILCYAVASEIIIGHHELSLDSTMGHLI